MKKGFTLIELLAVIVILAIISAIAIPIVIKVIDNVKISSLKISMSNIEKAIELYINKESINENKVFICSDGQCKDELNNKLEITGIVPEEGTINITPSGTITYNKLIIDGYLCDKYNKEFVCHKASKNIEEVKEESIIIQNTSTNLSNYKIYGNSIQDVSDNLIPTDWSLSDSDSIYTKEYGKMTIYRTEPTTSYLYGGSSNFIGLTLPDGTYTFSASSDTFSGIYVEINNNGTIEKWNNNETRIFKNEVIVQSIRCNNIKLSVGEYFWEANIESLTPTPESPIESLTPTPESPTIVESVGDKTKNLINPKASLTIVGGAYRGINFMEYAGQNITLSISLKEGKSIPTGITFSIAYRVEGNNGLYAVYFVKDGAIKNTSFNMFQIKNPTTLGIGVYPATQSNWDKIFDAFDVQLEFGTKVTDYEPYGYKIPVVAPGKNLFNVNNTSNWVNSTYAYYPIYIGANKKVAISWDNDLSAGQGFYLCIGNTSGQKGNGNASSAKQWLYHSTSSTLRHNITQVTADGEGYIYINMSPRNRGELTKLQVEYGTTATDFEPYKDITTNIYLKEPLRKVGNYVDYIDYKNQKLIKNVGIINLSSEDNFELIDDYFVLSLENYPKKDKEISISNYLEYENNFWFDGNKLKLKIEGINTVEELHNWLSDKNMEIHYPLSKSIVSSVELPEINLNKNYSNIKVDTNIKPSNMLIEYD